MVIGNTKGVGALKSKIFKGKYEVNWKFGRGRVGSMDIFWNHIHDVLSKIITRLFNTDSFLPHS